MSQKPTKITQELLDSLPGWIEGVLFYGLGLNFGDPVFIPETDWKVPWDKTPDVRIMKIQGDAYVVLKAKDNGLLDVFMKEGDEIHQYCDAYLAGYSNKSDNSIAEDLLIEYQWKEKK